ncbi:MAG: D-2-hydroxyacid dehydrogenase [Geminicoccaceae bacterium]
MQRKRPLKVLIASPLEPEQARRIAAAAPGRIEVIYEPDLLPVPRYVADHKGRPPELNPEQRECWLDHLREADILFDFDWLAPERLVLHAPRLRWVQGTSAGIGELLRRTGLIDTDLLFTTASGVHASPLAEFVILGLLYFYRDLPRLQRMQRAHHWERYTNRELAGSRALVVGLGAVGRVIAQHLAAQGLEVWGARRTLDVPPPEGVRRVLPMADLVSVLGLIDALILACPLTPETKGLIGAAELAAMPEGALLINVARGPVVDEEALVQALRGHLGGAALDVATVEPLPDDSPLWDLPNVLISPHSASTVHAENRRIVDIFLANLGRYLAGEPLINRFDPARGY